MTTAIASQPESGMPERKFIVTLAASERNFLGQLASVGKAPARSLTRARILLKTDASGKGPCWTDARIADALEVHDPRQ